MFAGGAGSALKYGWFGNMQNLRGEELSLANTDLALTPFNILNRKLHILPLYQILQRHLLSHPQLLASVLRLGTKRRKGSPSNLVEINPTLPRATEQCGNVIANRSIAQKYLD
jgi:hypothetical protein